MYVYRITRERTKPDYYQSKEQVLYGTGKRAAALAKYVKEQTKALADSGYSPIQFLKIERAAIGEFEDVTEEFMS